MRSISSQTTATTWTPPSTSVCRLLTTATCGAPGAHRRPGLPPAEAGLEAAAGDGAADEGLLPARLARGRGHLGPDGRGHVATGVEGVTACADGADLLPARLARGRGHL